MSDEQAVLEAQNAQRETAKASVRELMRSKKRRSERFTVTIEGIEEPLEFYFEALGGRKFDDLVTEHPPTTEQRLNGADWNPDTFVPALLARVSVDPRMTEPEWRDEVCRSDDWSPGEVQDLFGRAMRLCGKGIDVVPTSAG